MAEHYLLEIPEGLKSRFESRRIVAGPADCWQWTGKLDRKGYGSLGALVNGRKSTVMAHHVALELSGRRRASKQIACHSCDNPGCVNPDHLRWGSHADNSNDQIIRDRLAKGEANGRAKFTEADIRQIRADMRPNTVIARDYNVHNMAISLIKRRKRWGHVV